MSNKALEVGDTVILEGVVTEINTNGDFKFKSEGVTLQTAFWLNSERVKTIVPKPWIPKVGDIVINVDNDYRYRYEILYLDEQIAFTKMVASIPNAGYLIGDYKTIKRPNILRSSHNDQ